MNKNLRLIALSAAVFGTSAFASAQELAPSAFSGALARIAALKSSAVQAPAAAPANGAGQISYDEMAKSFDAAPPAASLSPLLGAWFQVAEADSQGQPGKYDPSGFFDWLHPGQPAGIAGKLIPAKPPIQAADAYEISWGYFDKTGANYAPDNSLVLQSNGTGGFVHIPGHMEDDPISCTNCGDDGPAQHWVDDQTFEFRVIGDKKDYVVERATTGGTFDPKTGAVKGGSAAYAGYRTAAR